MKHNYGKPILITGSLLFSYIKYSEVQPLVFKGEIGLYIPALQCFPHFFIFVESIFQYWLLSDSCQT